MKHTVPQHNTQELIRQAESFIAACYQELGLTEGERDLRLADIREEVQHTGTYKHTGKSWRTGQGWPGAITAAASEDCFGIP